MKKASVIITRFNENNELLSSSLISISKQNKCSLDVYMLDQKYSKYIEKLCLELSTKIIKFYYKKILPKGLSYAKNIGIKNSINNFNLTIDPDHVADRYWAFYLIKELENGALIVGPKVVPIFEKQFFLLKSSLIRDQYSLIDLGDKTIKVEKTINIGLNKEILKEKEYFDENLGRKNNNLLGGEETNLCSRVNKRGLMIKYVGKSILYHNIEKSRLSIVWIIKKIYFSGYTQLTQVCNFKLGTS